MSPIAEKRLLQIAIIAAAAFSLFFGTLSVVRGVAVLLPSEAVIDANLDSHFRYLSGIFLGVVVALVACTPSIEHKGARFRLLGGLVICGGVARLLGVLANGAPGTGHLIGLALELVATPALLLWQARLARRFAPKPNSPGHAKGRESLSSRDPPAFTKERHKHGQRPEASSPGNPMRLGRHPPNDANRPLN